MRLAETTTQWVGYFQFWCASRGTYEWTLPDLPMHFCSEECANAWVAWFNETQPGECRIETSEAFKPVNGCDMQGSRKGCKWTK